MYNAARLALLLFLTACAPAYAMPICPDHGRRADCVADADSLWIGRERHRHDIIDAPEIGHTAKCDAEIEIGLAARDRLSELLADGFDVRTTGAKGRYGRTLSTWWLPDGREAGEVLLDEGLAVVWPQRRDWCR